MEGCRSKWEDLLLMRLHLIFSCSLHNVRNYFFGSVPLLSEKRVLFTRRCTEVMLYLLSQNTVYNPKIFPEFHIFPTSLISGKQR